MPLSLSDAHLTVKTRYGEASEQDMLSVVSSMRFVSLKGLKLRSDRQPRGMLVENIAPGLGQWAPMVVATDRADKAAWIRVTIDGTHWARLAYQFGHELGHVLCNSWGFGAAPRVPCQWVEEVCVEAFSIRGLLEMSQRWTTKAPHPHWKSFSTSLEGYAENTLTKYRKLATLAEVGTRYSISEHYRSRLDRLLKLGAHAKA